MNKITTSSHDSEIRKYIQDGLTVGEIAIISKRSERVLKEYCIKHGYIKENELPLNTKKTLCLKIGDIIHSKTTINDKLKAGTVIYVHPGNWWYMVEFRVGDGVVRECYLL